VALRRRAWMPYTRRAVNSAATTVARVAMVTRTTPCPVMVGHRLFFAIPISRDRDAGRARDVTEKGPGRPSWRGAAVSGSAGSGKSSQSGYGARPVGAKTTAGVRPVSLA
jgi:hypothetical protein